MSWQEFELLVGEAFRLQGYEVAEIGGGGPDGGVDLVLRKDREKFLVQCKQWKAFKGHLLALKCPRALSMITSRVTRGWQPRARQKREKRSSLPLARQRAPANAAFLP